eukprot:gene2558-2954_t
MQKAFGGSQEEPKKDDINLFGMLVSAELHKLGEREQRIAKHQIHNVIFTMEMQAEGHSSLRFPPSVSLQQSVPFHQPSSSLNCSGSVHPLSPSNPQAPINHPASFYRSFSRDVTSIFKTRLPPCWCSTFVCKCRPCVMCAMAEDNYKDSSVISTSEIKGKVTVSLSNYAKKLESHVLKRYTEKIAYIGVDPLLIPENSFDPGCLPPVEATDLLSYLVLDTSYYTKNQFKAFRSLEAYNHMVSGFITSVQGKIVSKKIRRSGESTTFSKDECQPQCQFGSLQRMMGLSFLHIVLAAWLALEKCCSHVASMLFYLEVWTRLNGKLACTQKLKKDLDHAVNNFEQDPAGRMNENHKKLDSSAKGDTPVSYLDYEYHDLIKACSDIHITISDEDAKQIELDTKSQAKGSGFFHHRAGRIGASMSKSASHTDPSKPSQSLIKSICYPEIFKFTNAATEYGCQHEKAAIKLFEIDMKKKHVNYKAIQCGMFINKRSPFIHATPDFLSSCDCCGIGCGEVKCPFCMDGIDIDGYLEKPSSCLMKDPDGEVILKRNHQYFYQVQQQIFTTELPFCDFVVFGFATSKSAFLHERIIPDQCHWDKVLPRLSQFWQYCVLPEILGRWYTRKCHLSNQAKIGDTRVCFCGEETGERTVKCQNVDCPISLYHPSCLKVAHFSNNWYCPHCQRLPEFKRKTQPKTKDITSTKALSLESVCICQQKAKIEDKIIECHNPLCENGKFFHISCLGYKRKPNNSKTTWQCDKCKANPQGQPELKIGRVSQHFGVETGTHEGSILNKDSLAVIAEESRDIIITKEAIGQAERYAQLGTLRERHFELVVSPKGWLDCDIIHQVHVYLRNSNQAIEGFQRPTLGPSRNFDIVGGEFVQILHTGNSHWVCTSSIGCLPGMVSLYDSLYSHVVSDEIEEQIKNLIGADIYQGINVVPVQQQENGYDCGVFAIAFATCLVNYIPPETVEFDVAQLRQHLFKCLKAGKMELFPTI